MTVPITADAVNNGAQVQLGAEYVKHHVAVNPRGRKHALVHLEGMGTFGRLHHQVDDGVELDDHLVNLYRLQGAWDEHIMGRLWGGGARVGHDAVFFRLPRYTCKIWDNRQQNSSRTTMATRGAVGLSGGNNERWEKSPSGARRGRPMFHRGAEGWARRLRGGSFVLSGDDQSLTTL